MRYLIMCKTKLLSVLIIALLLPALVYAQPQTGNAPDTDQSTSSNSQESSTATKPANAGTANQSSLESEVMYCPKPEDLVRKGLWWGLGGNWKSYSQSFVKKLVAFVSVQWVGIKVGNVICVYSGPNQLSFPVQIQYGLLVNEPTGGLWQKNLGGYKNCFSSNRLDCPFTKMKKQQPVNLGKELEGLKQAKPSGVFESGF